MRVALGLGGWLGLAYAPADIAGLPDTYPFLRIISDMERETLLLWFSGILVAYLVIVEVRPYIRSALSGRAWLGLEEGGRYYRDLLVESGMNEGVKIFDSMSSPHPDQPTSSHVASAFRWIVQEAINEGRMEVVGTPENGSKSERLACVDDDATAYRKSREGESFFLMMNGVYYRNIQIKKSTIKSYADHVRAHDANLKKRVKA